MNNLGGIKGRAQKTYREMFPTTFAAPDSSVKRSPKAQQTRVGG
jgi:hypothetical protein